MTPLTAVAHTSDSDSESDMVPSRLPARAESCILAHDLTERPSCRFRMRTFIAVGHLAVKARYPEEANNVALDIKNKLGELALQHQP
jgi:hypothetical protein